MNKRSIWAIVVLAVPQCWAGGKLFELTATR